MPNYSLGQDLVILEAVGLTLLALVYNRYIKDYDKFIGVLVIVVLLAHTIISAIYLEYTLTVQIVVKTLRFTLYILSTYVFAQLFYERELFKRVFTLFFYISLFPFVFYYFNDRFFSVEEYYTNRFCGLWSEPSALGPFLTVFLIRSFLYRRIFILMLLMLVWFKTDSGSAYVILFVTALGAFGKHSFVLIKKLPIVLLMCFVGVFLFRNLDISRVSAFKKITDVFVYTDLSKGVAGQSRIQTLLNSINIMVREKALFIGYGTNTWETITNRRQDLRIFNLVHMLFISYGFWSFGMIGLIISRARKVLPLLSEFESLLCLSFLTSAFINSAQGALLWKVGLLFLFIRYNREDL